MVNITQDHGTFFNDTRVLGILIVAMVFGFGMLVGHAI